MFSELEVFTDVHIPSHIDENSNEENDVDDETMSGDNDVEGLLEGSMRDGGDILSRILGAVGAGTVNPSGTDGTGPSVLPRGAHDNDPQLCNTSQTDMLLLNLMRINGLTPRGSRRHGPKRQWSSSAMPEPLSPRGPCAQTRARRAAIAGPTGGAVAGPASAPNRGGIHMGGTRPRPQPRDSPPSPGQLRTRGNTRNRSKLCNE
ncbi:putative tripartite motif protein 37 [Operophtera brumata]|uniref:Putative tripartite motif protein 37 n=1 Tax=Operophtera brumata TaxID=104452 RepID=A0A0L7LQU6_OPEBR|nr:putative tripartite motif protein 37 [Operophtera brumata]